MMRKYEKIKDYVKEKKVNYLFCQGDDNFFKWFVGKNISHSLLFLGDEKPLLFKSPLETFNDKNYDLISINKAKSLLKKKLGVDPSEISLKLKEKMGAVEDCSDYMNKLRSVKEPDELNFIRKACSHGDKCISSIIKDFKGFKTEKDIERYIRRYALENDLGIAFDPIVASGANSKNAHHDNKGKIKKGFLVIDLGFVYKGYCSDMTRTFYVGTPNTEDVVFYNKVLEAQEKAIQDLKPGIKLKKLEDDTNEFFGKDKKYFIHSLGHGVGVEVHEEPFKQEILEKNMVVTIEPGLYKKQGVRIEDVMLIGDKKSTFLTKTTKKLLLL